ncbi:MAG TPA: AAA family ATPase [Methanosarcinales archaeon]|nr:AAA family ATPase [Methanosarcinales archaeon]
MKRIPFHNRERELKEVMRILGAEPSLITFVYGPINSGKTTMISHLIEQLPEDYAPFYVNLRGRFITDYEDFLNVLFEIDEGGEVDNVTGYAKSILKDLGTVSGIPIPKNLFEQIFEKKDKSKDVFKYIEQFLIEISNKRVPVLIIDELQVIGDLKINGLLMYKLFNFFIRLTKELHLCHIFVVSSDSLFIENVYSEAMLDGRCRYLVVDDFDYETTATLLERDGFTDEEKAVAWEYCGGKPVCLMEMIHADNRELIAKDMLKTRVTHLKDLLDYLDYTRPRIMIGDDEYLVEKGDIADILNKFVDTEYIDDEGLNRPAKHFLIKDNILFLDPHTGIIKPQSRLNLLAIREVLKDV